MSKNLKIISFSLWGNKAIYNVGAIENIRLAREIYPDWKCRFYVDDTVPINVINNIKKESAEVKIITIKKGAFWGMFWRFFANDDPDVEVFISRDCDSRLNFREAACVDEWLKSDKCFHTMHDHPYHCCVPILGGMWGAKKGCIKNIKDQIDKWGIYDRKGIDQQFLGYVIWPKVKNNCLRHDSTGTLKWGEFNPFPKHKPLYFGGSYVGEIFDENNNAIKP